MNPLTLLACLAVSTTAASAEPKDPAQVARDWNSAIEHARNPDLAVTTLKEQSAALTTTPLQRIFESPPPPPAFSPDRRAPSPDAPGDRASRFQPDQMPRGAKPWHYGDQIYWLVPLGSNPSTGL
jgi:hypothetical protein